MKPLFPYKIGPWQVQDKQLMYDNSWISVTHHQVTTPGGSHGVYGVVQFKHRAIAILPLTPDGYTWLVGQHRFPFDAYSWEIPEGGAHTNEDLLVAAKRELKEETGLEASSWQQILKLHLSNSVTNEVAYAFIATDLTEGHAEPEDTEDLCVKKVHLSEVTAMIDRGEITDALTIATVLKARTLGY